MSSRSDDASCSTREAQNDIRRHSPGSATSPQAEKSPFSLPSAPGEQFVSWLPGLAGLVNVASGGWEDLLYRVCFIGRNRKQSQGLRRGSSRRVSGKHNRKHHLKEQSHLCFKCANLTVPAAASCPVLYLHPSRIRSRAPVRNRLTSPLGWIPRLGRDSTRSASRCGIWRGRWGRFGNIARSPSGRCRSDGPHSC